MSSAISYPFTSPSAALARGIEDTVIYGKEADNLLLKGSCWVVSRVISTVVFPIFLTMDLIFKRIPDMLFHIRSDKFSIFADECMKYSLAIVPAIIFGLYSPNAMPGFFLQRSIHACEVRPFGVENIYGKTLSNPVNYPVTPSEVQDLVRSAAILGQQVSVVGAGMSQGTQTIPLNSDQCVIHTKYLNTIAVDPHKNTATVGSGVNWEELQLVLDRIGKSAIVKQASDVFSIGGSIGINCHGWAHLHGSIAQTVKELKIIDSNGNLRILPRPKEGVPFERLSDDEQLFKCMFGTMGYFGVVVEATLDIVDNEVVMEDARQIRIESFIDEYRKIQQDAAVQLFGGRLSLNSLSTDLFGRVCMDSYRSITGASGAVANRTIQPEPATGTRIQRIGLQLVGYLPSFSVRRLTAWFWSQERVAMLEGKTMTRNEALHPPIKSFLMLHESNLKTEWLQEYFIKPDRLVEFVKFLGKKLTDNAVRVVNATIRVVPKDEISILPYAEEERFAVVICFAQEKTSSEIRKTKGWIEEVNQYLLETNGVFYQAYMPYATKEQFESGYGIDRVGQMRQMKAKFDPAHVFGNEHTQKYYDV